MSPRASDAPGVAELAAALERAQAEQRRSQERLMDLEIRYTYLAELVDQLSELVRAQQAALDGVTGAVERLAKRVGPGAENPLDPDHEKPPHY